MPLNQQDLENAQAELRRIIGSDGNSDAMVNRARASSLSLVRSNSHLGFFSPDLGGWEITAFEAAATFDAATLLELVENRATAIVEDGCQSWRLIARRRQSARISLRTASDIAEVSQSDIELFEAGRGALPLPSMRALARRLGLDDLRLGITNVEESAFSVPPQRTLLDQTGSPVADEQMTLQLLDGAWAVKVQARLTRWMKEDLDDRAAFDTAVEPPTELNAVYDQGAELARHVRMRLGLGPIDPVSSVVDLIEDHIGIPVVWIDVPPHVAGAALRDGRHRGILVNVGGENRVRAGTRRVSIAHELAHLLLDPVRSWSGALVSAYRNMSATGTPEPLEARAQAFASELIAPSSGAARVFERNKGGRSGVRAVMGHYGVSRRCAVIQIGLGLKRRPDWYLEAGVDHILPDWQDVDFVGFGWIEDGGRPSVKGTLGRRCLEAYDANLITADTAAAYLDTTPEHVRDMSPAPGRAPA